MSGQPWRIGSVTEATTSTEKGSPRKISLPTLASALIAGLISLENQPWWILKGLGPGQILEVRVSPFYIHIDAVGVPDVAPFTSLVGSITRMFLVIAAFSLALSSLWPSASWRKITLGFSLLAIIEVYLSISLLMQSARTSILAAYGAPPPIIGIASLQGSVLGLDLSVHPNPMMIAAFTIPFYLGILGLALVGGNEFLRAKLNPRRLLAARNLTPGVKEVYLTPPYEQVWFSTSNEELNPLSRDPDRTGDDELAHSFARLNRTLQRGGRVSVILPALSSALTDRLLKLVPRTGLQLEKSDVIQRTPGKPENELVFRKPIAQREKTPRPQADAQHETTVQTTPTDLQPSEQQEVPLALNEQAEPVWAAPRMTRLERNILKSATGIISRRKEPVLYKDLLNEVYMELLDRKIEFESAKEIERTLLKHAGREIVLLEEFDEANLRMARRWWLGDKLVEPEDGPPLWRRFSASAKPRFLNVKQILAKWQRQRNKPRYRQKKDKDEV